MKFFTKVLKNKLFYLVLLLGVFIIPIFSFNLKAQEFETVDYSNKNLASPNLQGKEYLGDGVYRLYDANGVTTDYNVNSGIWTINGSFTGSKIFSIARNVVEIGSTYRATFYKISGTGYASYRPAVILGSSAEEGNYISYNMDSRVVVATGTNIRFLLGGDGSYDNLTFKLQLEKGDTATPYTVPLQAYIWHEKQLSYNDGYQEGYTDGEFDGYQYGYEAGELDGYIDGYGMGYADGENVGYREGFSSGESFGYDYGYDKGYNDGYDLGYAAGEIDGFNNGYDLGYAAGVLAGENKAYTDGYFEGRNDGIDIGYDLGYADGKNDGIDIGYADGESFGYDNGYNDGYDYGYDNGFDLGYNDGYQTAINDGSADFGLTAMLSGLFVGLGSLLSIELLPNISIGMIIAVPIVFGIIAFILGKRGGGD